jgi:hypothetical protein
MSRSDSVDPRRPGPAAGTGDRGVDDQGAKSTTDITPEEAAELRRRLRGRGDRSEDEDQDRLGPPARPATPPGATLSPHRPEASSNPPADARDAGDRGVKPTRDIAPEEVAELKRRLRDRGGRPEDGDPDRRV